MIVTIDTGANGAIVQYYDNQESYYVYKMPKTLEQLADLFWKTDICNADVIIMEDPPKTCMRNRPEARIAKLFEQVGFLKGCILASNAPYKLVNPRKWQRAYSGIPKDYQARKTALWKLAQELFNYQKVHKYAADAWLLLDWYLRFERE